MTRPSSLKILLMLLSPQYQQGYLATQGGS